MKIFIVALLLAIGYAQTERRLLDEVEGEAEEKSQCTNEFSKKECRTIYTKDLCGAFYDKCQKKCGCFSDQAGVDAFRKENNIDDSLVEGECLPNDDTTFEDTNGFGCKVYEGSGWCAPQSNGEAEYGDRWCDWFPLSVWQDDESEHWCKIRTGRHRMSRFEAYTDDVTMPDARSCCCDGTLFEEYKSTYEVGFEDESTTCEDYKINGHPWHDDKGWNCATYHYGNLCTSNGERGSGWKNQEWGTLQEHAFGTPQIHAKEACCACGGGHTTKHWARLPVNLKRIDKFLGKTFDVKNIRRAKKHFHGLKYNIEKRESENWYPELVVLIDACIDSADGKPNQESTWLELQQCWAEFRNAVIESDGENYPFLKAD